MQSDLTFHIYDVFTGHPYSGNPLAIVEEADALSTSQMQRIARQFNLSETIFVMTPRDPAHAARVRIFFPTAEIPFAGHPTLGCAVHLARQSGEERSIHLVLEEEAGLVPVDLVFEKDGWRGEFSAPILPERSPLDLDVSLLADAIGVAEADVDLSVHAPAAIQGGPTFLFVPLSGLDALRVARPSDPAWSALTSRTGLSAVYIYAPTGETGPDAADFQARLFAPDDGIPEDPATGSATALLSAQLMAGGMVGEGITRFSIRQGVEMGRPSELALTTNVENGALVDVRVGGVAVPVATGKITPPRD